MSVTQKTALLEPQHTLSAAAASNDFESVRAAVVKFVSWLDRYGETSYDHQSFFAGDVGRAAKALYYKKPLLGTIAVAPMIFCEAFLPSARRFFHKRQRFPIADAHYAMGFAFLADTFNDRQYRDRAVHFLEVLKQTRCSAYERYCWGYPFHWQTRNGIMKAGIPLITTVPYVYEAFRQIFQLDRNPAWQDIMRSVADHALLDYHDYETSPNAASCSYTPEPSDRGGVVNASAYRAFLLTQAGIDFGDENYLRVALRNLNFVIQSQNRDGSWYYSVDGERDFVDHFHTCFVLKALAKIEAVTGNRECTKSIESGVAYYVNNLFDEQGLPKPFSRRPRMTVYRHELYDYAECINVAVLLHGRFPALDEILSGLVSFGKWQKRNGSFRARKLLIGWDNTPMHRWAQSQMFRSLCFLLRRSAQN